MDNIVKVGSPTGNTVPLHKEIKSGSKIIIGEHDGKIEIHTSKHFNWFQKKMIKCFFGFEVVDFYSDQFVKL